MGINGGSARVRAWMRPVAVTTVLSCAALAVALQPPAAPRSGSSPSTSWLGKWMGSASAARQLTLADVRAIIGASTGKAATLTGAGVGIALIDTGVAPVPGLPATQVVNGPDLSFESQDPDLRYLDTFGHGTHMAGIIVGNDPATGTKGLAPGAKLTSVKVGAADGSVDASQVIAAIDWVVLHRNDDPAYPIRVINLSYGTGGNPSSAGDPVQYAVEQAWKAGIVVVAAVGNSADPKLSDPASDPYIVAAGSATTKGTLDTADDDLSPFSNGTGTAVKMRTYDVVVPGESILSLRDPGSSIDNDYPAARVGDTLFRGTGTSQASAVTTAAVALILQSRPTLTPDQTKKLLSRSATQLPNGPATGKDLDLVNVNSAITSTVPLPAQSYAWSTGGGRLEDARGSSHVVDNGVALTGENTIFGPFNAATWAAKSATHTSWVGGKWMGVQVTGGGWTGTSWASMTWASAAWLGTSWSGAAWVDPNWDGRYWSGRYWSGRYWSSTQWSGRYWSSMT